MKTPRLVLIFALMLLSNIVFAQDPCDVEASLGFAVAPIICEEQLIIDLEDALILTEPADSTFETNIGLSTGNYVSTFFLSADDGQFVTPLVPSSTVELSGLPAGYYCLQQLISPTGSTNDFNTAGSEEDIDVLAEDCVSISTCGPETTFYNHLQLDVSHGVPYCNGDGSWSVDITVDNATTGGFLYDPNGFYASDKLFENGIGQTVTTYSSNMICILPIDVTAALLLGPVEYDGETKSYDVEMPDETLLEALTQCNEILFIYPPECSICTDEELVVEEPTCGSAYEPVCACDGLTYQNACLAEQVGGQTSWTPGTCHEVCVEDTAVDMDIACFGIFEPVCGCNGETYDNACIAEYKHGVLQWSPGPCPPTCYNVELQDPLMDCEDQLAPVCGCDGVNYYNACEAIFQYGIAAYTLGPCNGGGAIARKDSISVLCEQTAAIDILSNDLLHDNAVICQLSYPPFIDVIYDEGTLLVTPVPGFFGAAEIRYQLCADSGPVEAKVAVNFFTANEQLPALDIYYEVEGSALLEADLLSQWGMPQTEIDDFCELQLPANGSLTAVGDKLLYVANEGFEGADSFTYQLCISTGCGEATLEAQVHLQVSNDCSNSSVYCTQPMQPVTLNPQFCDLEQFYSIVDMNSLFLCSLSLANDSQVVYTALPAFEGLDLVTLIAQDNDGMLDTAYVSLLVGDCEGDGLVINDDWYESKSVKIPSMREKGLLSGLADACRQFVFNEAHALERAEVLVFDLHGREVWSDTYHPGMRIDLLDLPTGVYVVQLRSPNLSLSEKIILK